jgi:serine/threonine-protein kinase
MAHPNIVTVYDVGQSGEVAFMAMELLEGDELGTLVRRPPGIALRRAIDIASQIAEGLAYAHARGVVHRDVKPSNIMVTRDGLVKITDFGIARRRASQLHTQTGVLLGSPRYMSPEVFLGKRADARSDIFSAGILLYEMLTGTAPFSGDSVSALMYQTINVVPPAPSVVRPSLPAMLDFIIAKTLAKEPQERYSDARHLAADLRECARRLEAGVVSSPGTRLPHASLSSQEIHVLADTGSREDLLDRTLPMTRGGDDPSGLAPPAPTLGISRIFDSLQATQRLALSMEQDVPGPPVEESAAARSAACAPADLQAPERYRVVSGPPAATGSWTRLEIAVFGAGVCLALAIAALIALA